MGFDKDAFMAATLEARTQDFPVPHLKEWFGEKDKPTWKIKNLTGAQLGIVDELADSRPIVDEIIDAISSKSRKAVADEVKKLVGNTEDKTKMMARRIYLLQYGSVPECELDVAVKYCDEFPTQFIAITNAIILLSGQGSVSKKK
jgi:hypothetical protein